MSRLSAASPIGSPAPFGLTGPFGPTSPFGRGLARFRRHPAALPALAFLTLLALACAAAPWLGAALDLDPEAIDILARKAGPSPAHPLGTDELGRDTLIRLLHAGRVSLSVGLLAALIAAGIGTAIGVVAGWSGGMVEQLAMRVTDTVLALPLLPVLIVVGALDFAALGLDRLAEDPLARLVAIIALFGWPQTARLVRAETLALKARDHVRAARALGCGPLRIIGRHLLPNLAGPVITAATLAVGAVILAESVLSFLGVGIQPPTPSWGNMLTNAQTLMFEAPRLAILPGLMVFLTVVACNFLGDGLMDAIDPRA